MTPSELAAGLLEVVRHETGCIGAEYSEPPSRLGGGFYTENHAFSLSGVAPRWSGPLVLRVFPNDAPPELARVESAVQMFLASRDLPVPDVVLYRSGARLDGRRYFIMERLPGAPAMGGARIGEVVRAGRLALTRLPEMTATAHARLHRIDPTPLVEELGDVEVGVQRWFRLLADVIEEGAHGLRGALEWLVANRPTTGRRLSLCHGDLWGGNILVDGSSVTGLIDWTVATVAEPALDVGFTATSLSLAPVLGPAFAQRAASFVGRRLSASYVESYRRSTGADLGAQPYYEALRGAIELAAVARFRLRAATSGPHDAPRTPWDSISDQVVSYVGDRTGVLIAMPD